MAKKPDNISRMAAMGRTMGISSGNLMALHNGKNVVMPNEPEKLEAPGLQCVTIICQHCGKEFIKYDRREHKFCSELCKAKAYYARHPKRKNPDKAEI